MQLAPRVAAYRWPGRSFAFPLEAMLEHRPGLERIVFNREGDRLLAAGSDGSASLFQVSDGRLLAEVPSQNFKHERDPLFEGNYVACDFSPDGTSFVLAGRPARIWEQGSLRDLPMDAVMARYAPDGRSILLGGKKEAALVRGDQVLKLAHGDWMGGASFSPDGKWIATFGGKFVRLWEAASGRPGPSYENGGAAFYCAEFDPGSGCLVAGSDDCALVWDLAGHEQLKIAAPEPVMAAGFDSRSNKLALGCSMGRLGVWDAHAPGSASQADRDRLFAHHGVHFLPDDRRLLASSFYGLCTPVGYLQRKTRFAVVPQRRPAQDRRL